MTRAGIRRASPVPPSPPVPLATAVCTDLAIGRPPAEEVRRHLGYPADALPKARIAERIEAVAAEAEGELRPRGVYAVYAVEAQSPRRIQVAGVAIRGDVARFVGTVDRVGVVVATAGAEISELSERHARDGDSLDAWIADAIGSWAAEAAADAVTDRLSAHAGPGEAPAGEAPAGEAPAGEAVTLRYSPGYCGMSMAQQRVLFGLVDAEAVGVDLLPSMLMRPLKSVSGIVGFGPVAALNAVAQGTPCDACGRLDCHMRR